jgi:hypothetical protein
LDGGLIFLDVYGSESNRPNNFLYFFSLSNDDTATPADSGCQLVLLLNKSGKRFHTWRQYFQVFYMQQVGQIRLFVVQGK